MRAETDGAFNDRIQLLLDSVLGPFSQDGPLGAFDPRRDLEVYVDGKHIPVRTFSFDANNNRYLLFMDQQFNLQGVVQVVHHMPSPSFLTGIVGWGGGWGLYWGFGPPPAPVGGFALLGTFVP